MWARHFLNSVKQKIFTIEYEHLNCPACGETLWLNGIKKFDCINKKCLVQSIVLHLTKQENSK